MARPRILVLRAPGTNCDGETAYAFERAGGQTELMHVNRLIESPGRAGSFQVLCLPGGFSYGDDIAAGRILADQVRHHLQDVLREFREQDRLVLGICNGFQVLLRTGMIVPQLPPPATLTWNDSGRFEDRWVHVSTASPHCVFLRSVDTMYVPVAHAEGKFVSRDEDFLDRCEEEGLLALRYTTDPNDGHESADVPYPANPNGSMRQVAGMCDATGRIFGLMPHPERHIDPTHHPAWTRREEQPAEGDGLTIFRNAVRFFE